MIYKYYLNVKGLPSEVQAFNDRLNTPDADGNTFWDRLIEKYGVLPSSVNPFEEIRELIFQYNTFFIRSRYGLLNPALAGQLFSVLQKTISAGSDFFLITSPTDVEEGFSNALDEEPEIFYAVETEDDHFGTGDFTLVESIS